MSEKSLIEEKIRKIIKETTSYKDSIYEIKKDESLQLNSTELLEVLVGLEEVFDITISDEELLPKTFENISQVVDFICKKLSLLKSI